MKQRILELSHRHKLGHLSSNLTTSEILALISLQYATHHARPFIVLSCGHSGLALYCYLEMFCGQNAEQLLNDHGAQPHLDPVRGIHCSTGSLGQGLTVAVGYALADRHSLIHCIISDGECAEGCVWEALAFARLNHLDNLIVHVNMNGYSALGVVDQDYLTQRLKVFLPSIQIHLTNSEQLPFLHGVHAHYKVMTDEEFETTKNAENKSAPQSSRSNT